MKIQRRIRRRRWAVVVAAFLLVGLGAGMSWSRGDAPASQVKTGSGATSTGDRVGRGMNGMSSETVSRVRAVPVRRADLSLRKEATGYLEPWRSVEVSAEISGLVLERRVEEGQWVEAGHLLVILDDRDRRLEAEEAEAEWLKLRARYAVSYELEPDEEREFSKPKPRETLQAELERKEGLYEQGLISRQELEEARRRREGARLLSGDRRHEVRSASLGLAQAEQRLARSRLALDRTRIVAPFSGRIADLAVEPGQQVQPGDVLLALLADDRLQVDVDVLETDIVHLEKGAPARVRVPAVEEPGGSQGVATFEGRVHTINPRVDPETGTGRVTVVLPNRRGRLLPGLFAYVELEIKRLEDQLLVPEAAVLERQGRELVFRIEDGRAEWTYVTTGARSGHRVAVLDGLEGEDIVAVANHFTLAHEAPVEVILATEGDWTR